MMLRAALMLLGLVLPLLITSCADAAPQRVREPMRNLTPPPRGDVLLESSMLTGHSRARTEVGAAPLTWNDALAADALAYAREMARTRKFAHARQRSGRPPQGENLFVGTRGAYRYGEMVGLWIDERRDFRPGIFPDNSRTGNWPDVGHYTQIIWPTTRQVGCAVASNDTDDYLVCRYSPAGNVVGQNPLIR